LAFLLSTGALTVRPDAKLMASSTGEQPSSEPQKATVKTVSATTADIPFDDDESQAELELLILANQSRQQAGAPPLTLDAGLSKAALAHGYRMLDARQLSHQFEDEPSVLQRLVSSTGLQLDQTAENVALDYGPERGHQHLMLSPSHRANLLNPAYNVVGLAVVRSGDRLYIVQDFGHAVASYSSVEWKDRVAAAVNQLRHDGGQRALPRLDLGNADDLACSMMHADKLGTSPVQALAERYTVFTFTSLHPDELPTGANHAIASRNLRSFSVGACYGRTESYPAGVYWVVLTLD
jgi:uncharacterized protein YkwD